jgi:hypothetical protein
LLYNFRQLFFIDRNIRQKRRGFMPGKEDLEADFNMYNGAAEDLENHGGDKEVVEALRTKARRVVHMLNIMRFRRERTKSFFSDIGRKPPR